MKIKIWGARGSTPAPLRPETIREKIVSAILGIAKTDQGELREELISAISENPQPGETSDLDSDEAYQKIQAKRRQIIEAYLDSLSPLAASTASGNTPCVEIRSGEDLFIIDAGSGIRELGQELMKGPWGRGEGVIHLLFSHPHWDHIQGFPFFRPAFIPGNKIFIYGVHDMEGALRRQQEFISFPVSLDYMQATMNFIQIKPDEVLEFGDLRIRNIRNQHPGDAYGYRFEKGNKVFVYASDAAYPDDMDRRLYLNFFAEADLLMFDAQFTQRESDEKQDWGHSSSFVGVEMAQQAKVKNLVLFHFDPTYFDQDLEKILEDTLKFQQNQYPTEMPVNVMIGQEGQTFDLTPPPATQIQQVPGSKAVILKPAGIFDEHVAAELREQLDDMLTTDWPSQLIIDMSDVEMLQVAGLRVLVRLRKEHQGTPMALAGPSINVQQLIELAGYLDFFAIYPSVHMALNALQARETLDLPGQIIKNRYRIEAKIGDGRLGTVFKATDTQINSAVAIKILSPSFSEGALEQFLRQARQIVDLVHSNIVTVYDCDEDRGISFMVEEFVESRTLQDLIDENQGQPLPFDIALSVAGSITRALEYAHTRGIVHGDLKPKNVLLGEEIKISDFGLGRLESGRPLLNINVPLALVTARYLAPEQVLGHPIDARTDLYALGVILYELFTGQPPFDGTDQEVLEHHRSSQPTPPRALNPGLSCSLEHLILKLLDKDPNKRYATVREVQRILGSMSVVTSGDLQQHDLVAERPSDFVGREGALDLLTGLWAETQQGRGQLVFISGESGIGKTRLTEELVFYLDEATLFIGNSQKLDGSAAYHPFLSALKSYFANISSESADKNMGSVWAEIGQLIPEIGQIIPGIAAFATSATPPAQLPTTSLAQSIVRATSERPWLLILDDLHWADQGSLKLLDYLARHCGQMALMIVGTYQDSGLEENEFLAETLDGLRHQANHTAIALEQLTEGEVKEILENIWSQSVPGDLITAIYNRTGGNPLYAEEVARGLIDDGVVSWRDNKWYFGPVVEVTLPQSITETISRRINRLSRETQTLLNQAAVLGQTFNFDDLSEMSDLSEWDVLEGLSIALERQFIKEIPPENRLCFSHVEIQQTLYNSLSSLKRRLMHREAGEALERQYLPESGEITESLAFHFFQAGEPEKGLTYGIEAARRANIVYADTNALYWYTLALEVMDQLDPDNQSQQQRFELLLDREQVYDDQGVRRGQMGDLIALQELAQALNDPTRQAVVHNRRSAYEYVMNRLTEATTEARAGLIAARQANNLALEVESLTQLAYLALHQGQFDLAREQLQPAQKILKGTDDRQAMARYLRGLGAVHKHLNDYPKSEEYYQQALTTNQLTGDRRRQAACLSDLGDVALKKGEYLKAKSYQQQALAIYQMIGSRPGQAIGLSRLAAIYAEMGHYDMARDHLEQAMSIHRGLKDEQGLAADLRLLGIITALTTGDFIAARDHLGQALEIFQHSKNKFQEGNTWLELALIFEGLADLSKASQAYNQARNIYAETGRAAGILDARTGLARCLLVEDKIDEAQQEVKLCLDELKARGVWGVKYPIRLYLTAYRVLQAANNTQEAATVLQQGYTLLQERAHDIDPPDLQSSFSENVPENKELLAELKQHQVEEISD